MESEIAQECLMWRHFESCIPQLNDEALAWMILEKEWVSKFADETLHALMAQADMDNIDMDVELIEYGYPIKSLRFLNTYEMIADEMHCRLEITDTFHPLEWMDAYFSNYDFSSYYGCPDISNISSMERIEWLFSKFPQKERFGMLEQLVNRKQTRIIMSVLEKFPETIGLNGIKVKFEMDK